MKRSLDLTADCTSCSALCCVVFAFDKSESFGIDKAACEVCPNLDDTDRCRIFDDRTELGFKGCIAYSCHGAGQRVTREVFKGDSWRDNPVLMAPMGAALSVMRRIHELLFLLDSAKLMSLSSEEMSALLALENLLDPETEWTESKLQKYPIDAVSVQVRKFLNSLQHHVTGRPTAHT
ncbi:hypothetical protein [Labrenzia sp. DG1229]|uniref:hypothetical protein n=1 Tax=Labrenzia sp. DG1229 TaxID=681847 RepID=UPI0004916DE5|nr:hypothetical protein [Labrenzia sp. DG1229]